MNALCIFSAGAAQAVVARLAQTFQRQAGCTVSTSFGAVQSMKSCIQAGAPADVIVLTNVLIDELMEQDLVVRGSRKDLGTVGTGLAVRAHTPRPSVTSEDMVREALLAASRIVCPDPAFATAGKVLRKVLAQLGIAEQVGTRLHYCASGHEAIAELARGSGARDIGVVQMTEIVANDCVELAGPLPGALQDLTVYSAGLVKHSRSPERAAEFIQRLVGEPDVLRAAGFGAMHASAIQVRRQEDQRSRGSALP